MSTRNTIDVSTMKLLPCRVEPGMFGGEYLAHIEVLDPQNPEASLAAQVFVDEHEVTKIKGVPQRKNPVPACLRVEVIGEEKGLIRVALPQPAQPVGETALIPEDRLLAGDPG